MSRKRKRGLSYFSHDTTAHSDDKIEALIHAFGNDGYAVYFILLELVYRTDVGILDLSIEDIKSSVIRKCNVEKDRFLEIVEMATKINLFNYTYWKDRSFITSDRILTLFGRVRGRRQYLNKYYRIRSGKDTISQEEKRCEHEIPEQGSSAERCEAVSGDNMSKLGISTSLNSYTTPKLNKTKLNQTKQNKTKPKKGVEFNKDDYLFFNSVTFSVVWDQYQVMREKIKSPMTDYAKQLLIHKLVKLSDNDILTAIEMMKESIEHNWQSVYALKDASYVKRGSVRPCRWCGMYHSTQFLPKHVIECSKNPNNIISVIDLSPELQESVKKVAESKSLREIDKKQKIEDAKKLKEYKENISKKSENYNG